MLQFDKFFQFQMNKGFTFESETDTEVIAKLAKYFYDQDKTLSFRQVIAEVVTILVCKLINFKKKQGAFAIVIKSLYYPNECIAYRVGSPLVLGIKAVDQPRAEIDVQLLSKNALNTPPRSGSSIEYFLASDSSAIADHTKNVVFLEHNDLLHFKV